MSKEINRLRKNLAAADATVKALAVESRDLPEKIRDARREESQGRLRAARGGVAVVEKSSLPALRERQESIGLDLWAARVNRGEIALELEQSELKRATERRRVAHEERQEAERAYRDAKAAFDGAASEHMAAAGAEENARARIRQIRRDLDALEQNPPLE